MIENTRIRAEMKKDVPNAQLGRLVNLVVYQIHEYIKSGFQVVGIIGSNRSPNCGVETTSDNNSEINGMGLFIEKISSRLLEDRITVPTIGIKGTDDLREKLEKLMQLAL